MSRTGNERAQRSASLVWGLLFIIIAALTVLTSNHLVDHGVVRIGLALALVATGIAGLVTSGAGARGRIGDAGPPEDPPVSTPTTEQGEP